MNMYTGGALIFPSYSRPSGNVFLFVLKALPGFFCCSARLHALPLHLETRSIMDELTQLFDHQRTHALFDAQRTGMDLKVEET